MTTTYEYTNVLTIVECAQCHMDFGVQRHFERDRRNDHGSFYCPSGHSNYFPHESEAEKLKRRAAWYAQQLASREEDLRAAKVAHAATKGQLTKTRKRAEKGVCLHCNRSFANVQRHVEHMHPEKVPA